MSRIIFLTLSACLTIHYGIGLLPANAQNAPTGTIFHPPVRLQAGGKIIDTGAAWGHSAPCIADLDRDGLDDLIVGDFAGKFRLYRNIGGTGKPAYEDQGFIKAGDEDAAVNNYCCIGGQPRFHDLNGDGIRDLFANSYDPGHCHIFRGLPDNRFAPREELLDKTGVHIRSVPTQKQNHQSFGSFFEMVDWENDGDLDILIGCFDGTLKLRINEGTKTKPEFASENSDVRVPDGPLKVKAHLCPKVADWDGDGLWDIIAGSDDGSVTFFKNVGDKKSPAFAQGEILVKAHAGYGYNRVIWDDSGIVPGIRSQVEVVDHNGDGQLDLLVGDFYTAFDLKRDLSPRHKQEVERLIAEIDTIDKATKEKLQALRKEFAERYPGDQSFSDEAEKAWSTEYLAMWECPEAQERERKRMQSEKSLRSYLATSHGNEDENSELAPAHGHVWLYLRK